MWIRAAKYRGSRSGRRWAWRGISVRSSRFAVRESALRVRVRSGVVEVWRDDRPIAAHPGTELTVTDDGAVSGTVPAFGPAWDWVVGIAPAIEIDGQPLAAFLDEISREHGWLVRYDDVALAREATTIVLHGSVAGLAPHEAVSVAVTTSWLDHRLEDGEIAVSRMAQRDTSEAGAVTPHRRAPRHAATARLLVLMALIAEGAVPAFAQQPPTLHEGQPLSDALQALQVSGLRLVFSTKVVTPDMRVRDVPRAQSPRARARRVAGGPRPRRAGRSGSRHPGRPCDARPARFSTPVTAGTGHRDDRGEGARHGEPCSPQRGAHLARRRASGGEHGRDGSVPHRRRAVGRPHAPGLPAWLRAGDPFGRGDRRRDGRGNGRVGGSPRHSSRACDRDARCIRPCGARWSRDPPWPPRADGDGCAADGRSAALGPRAAPGGGDRRLQDRFLRARQPLPPSRGGRRRGSDAVASAHGLRSRRCRLAGDDWRRSP